MARILPGYYEAVAALTPLLDNLPGRVVGIDGRDGTGKTTLGRYLAWHFNISLIETDLFLRRGRSALDYRADEITQIINARLAMPRPVIVEAVALFQLMQKLDVRHDFVIYLQVRNHSTSPTMESLLRKYEETFHPVSRADLLLNLAHGDADEPTQ